MIPKAPSEKNKLKLIIKNFGWLFGDRILRLGVGVLTTIWIARYLGPSDFGLLNYAIAFVAIISALSTLGLDQIAVRNIVLAPQNKNETIGTAFFLRISGSIVLILLSIILVTIIRPNDSLSLLLILIVGSGTIFQSFDVIDFWFQSSLNSKYTVYAKNTAFGFVSLLRILFILTNSSIVYFAIAILIENILGGSFLAAVYTYKKEKISEWKARTTIAISLLKDSWPLILSGIAIMIYMRIDQIMLKEMLGDTSVGIYSAAVRLAEVWYFIPIAIVNSVFPILIETKKVSEAQYYRRLSKLYSGLTWMAIIVAIIISLGANYIVNFLYGNDYSGAGAILSLNIWAGIFVFQGIARGLWLISENLQKYSYYYTIGACIVNIGLNFYLIPIMEGKGAAIATLISYFFSVIIFPLFIKETRNSSVQLLKSFLWR
ncbi:MAG: hypothetical protein A2V93_04345 [Ignavibacteria bacterium RBG_16_34_14]|nr:MAG: hypothetical protein A2V93_04345 [Ignavibacteria bacterium RBG_16_34_14]